jgi:hypothetical protein
VSVAGKEKSEILRAGLRIIDDIDTWTAYGWVTIHNRLIDFMYGNFLIDKSYHTFNQRCKYLTILFPLIPLKILQELGIG